MRLPEQCWWARKKTYELSPPRFLAPREDPLQPLLSHNDRKSTRHTHNADVLRGEDDVVPLVGHVEVEVGPGALGNPLFPHLPKPTSLPGGYPRLYGKA